MIDEKKLIEKSTWYPALLYKGEPTWRDGWNECNRDWIKRIEEQPKVGQWIPCSERLPGTYGEYLTSREHYEGYDIGILLFDPKQDFDVEFWKDEIDAWMPLPPAFKESED